MKRSLKGEAKGKNETAKKPKKKDTKAKAGSGFDTRWKFKVEPQPPKFPFKDQYFELNIFLVDQDGKLKCGFEVPIALDLFVEGESVPVSTTTSSGLKSITIDESTPSLISKTGSCKLMVKVGELSMNRNNRKFCFVVKRQPGPRGLLPRDVNPVMTRAMLVINSQIKVLNEVPSVWYKDQGGRDKCIDIDLELRGPNGLQLGREVPLKAVLLYEDFQRVINQDILQPSPTTTMVIGKTGKAQIRLRIEDVSKNHQSKSFRIRVEPDTSKTPIHFDKSPDMTGPILVRSKLNRRQKMKLLEQSRAEQGGKVENLPSGVSAPLGPAMMPTTSTPTQVPHPVSMGEKDVPIPDLSKLPPDVGPAIWCEHARETLASFHMISSRLLFQYDNTVRPGILQILNRYQREREGAMGNQLQEQNSFLQEQQRQDSEGGDDSPGPPPSLLPNGPPNVNPPENFDRGVSISSQGLSSFMRSTTGLLRSLSGSIGFGYGNDGNNAGHDSGPADFGRQFSLFSVGGGDDNFGGPLPKMPSVGGNNVPRMNSLADFSSSSMNDRQKSTGTSNVAYLLKQLYKVRDEVKGLPAFDENKQLVGFYFQHGDSANAITGFKCVEQAFIGPEHVSQCENALQEQLNKGTRNQFVQRVKGEEGYNAADLFFESM
uniref:Uncharacterized protein n=1 Tax=Mucochytrium quahogii TaxID=96639 RepID=A0A7S2RMX5_9STRA|mmetsp:Transcript_14994/g.26268  ORF Transcript_14994/g.26268 Transcript_14994/m.26268 type:complete len:656 (+) Transcript_14994:711-2678(+)